MFANPHVNASICENVGADRDRGALHDTRRRLARRDRVRARLPNWVKRPLGTALCNSLIGYLIGKWYREHIPHRGTIIDVASRRVRNREKAALFWSLYERAEIDQVCAFVEAGFDVVDLGASIGATTTQIVKQVDEAAQVVAVEADPEIFELLQRNVALNGGDAVTPVNAAIDYAGRETVAFLRSDSSLGGRLAGSGDAASGPHVMEVKATTLGELVSAHLRRDYILVADIEGAELAIFVHDAAALRRCHRVIVEIENPDFEGTVRRIEGCGFCLRYRHFNCLVFDRVTQSGQPQGSAPPRT